MRYAVRVFGWIIGALALPAIGAGAAGHLGGVVGATVSVLAVLGVWLWMPRYAHGAFEAGKYRNASRRYRVLEALAVSAGRERAAQLSRAGCYVAADDLGAAERLLGSIDAASLEPGERAVWLNNRACATLAAGSDPASALALVDEASALRPDVPALQHTRGMALLAVGRVDDAIGVLDGMRAAGELPRRLEADRCRDLARAWTQKGQTAYAEDYRLRAEALAR